MNHRWQAVGMAGFLASVTGCGGVTMRQEPTSDRLGVPRITAERLQGCVNDFGEQLPPGSWAFSPEVRVAQDGRVDGVNVGNVPETAPDLAACTREALSDMTIPSSVFNMRATQSASTDEPTVEQRSHLGHPAVVVVVVVGLGELAFEAGAYTILFAVTVKVVEKAADDVAELVKKKKKDREWDECLNRYEACVAGPLYRDEGTHIKDSRCGLCLGICRGTGKWPAFVDIGPCL